MNKERYMQDITKSVIVYTTARVMQGLPLDTAWKVDMCEDILSLLFYYYVTRRVSSSCTSNNSLFERLKKTISIVAVSNILSGASLTKLVHRLVSSIIGSTVYWMLVEHGIMKDILSSVHFKDGCMEDMIENIILMSLNDTLPTKAIIEGVIYKIIALFIYHYIFVDLLKEG